MAGRRAVTEAIRVGDAFEVLVFGSAKQTPGMRAVLEAAEGAGLTVHQASRDQLDSLAPNNQGVVARVRARARDLTERDIATFPFSQDAIVVVLDGVSDPQNLGAAARSAEAAGSSMLVSRTVRAADVTPAAIRASAGALLHLPHARVANIPRAIERLQHAGFFVIGLTGEAETTIYDEPCPPGRIAIVIGSEGEGMSRLARERCDALVSLPMRGKVGSLNASASLAAALFGYVYPSPGRNAE